jgi:SAM-dependent methyltransferase
LAGKAAYAPRPGAFIPSKTEGGCMRQLFAQCIVLGLVVSLIGDPSIVLAFSQGPSSLARPFPRTINLFAEQALEPRLVSAYEKVVIPVTTRLRRQWGAVRQSRESHPLLWNLGQRVALAWFLRIVSGDDHAALMASLPPPSLAILESIRQRYSTTKNDYEAYVIWRLRELGMPEPLLRKAANWHAWPNQALLEETIELLRTGLVDFDAYRLSKYDLFRKHPGRVVRPAMGILHYFKENKKTRLASQDVSTLVLRAQREALHLQVLEHLLVLASDAPPASLQDLIDLYQRLESAGVSSKRWTSLKDAYIENPNKTLTRLQSIYAELSHPSAPRSSEPKILVDLPGIQRLLPEASPTVQGILVRLHQRTGARRELLQREATNLMKLERLGMSPETLDRAAAWIPLRSTRDDLNARAAFLRTVVLDFDLHIRTNEGLLQHNLDDALRPAAALLRLTYGDGPVIPPEVLLRFAKLSIEAREKLTSAEIQRLIGSTNIQTPPTPPRASPETEATLVAASRWRASAEERLRAADFRQALAHLQQAETLLPSSVGAHELQPLQILVDLLENPGLLHPSEISLRETLAHKLSRGEALDPSEQLRLESLQIELPQRRAALLLHEKLDKNGAANGSITEMADAIRVLLMNEQAVLGHARDLMKKLRTRAADGEFLSLLRTTLFPDANAEELLLQRASESGPIARAFFETLRHFLSSYPKKLMTSKTRRAIERLYRMRGLPTPTGSSFNRLAAYHEVRLTERPGSFIRQHHPRTGFGKIGYGIGLSAIWSATLLLPIAATWFLITVCPQPSVIQGVLGVTAGFVLWEITHRRINIAAHWILNDLLDLLRWVDRWIPHIVSEWELHSDGSLSSTGFHIQFAKQVKSPSNTPSGTSSSRSDSEIAVQNLSDVSALSDTETVGTLLRRLLGHPIPGQRIRLRLGDTAVVFHARNDWMLSREDIPLATSLAAMISLGVQPEREDPSIARTAPTRTPRPRKMTDEQVSDLIADTMRDILGDQNVLQLSARYSVDTINLLWAILGPRLPMDYDADQFRELFDGTLLQLKGEEIEAPAGFGPVALGATDFGEQGRPRPLETALLNQEDISVIGSGVQQYLDKLSEEEAAGWVEKGIAEIAKGAAREFFRKLEEDKFAREFSNEQPDPQVLNHAQVAVERAIQGEAIPVVQEALSGLLKDIKKAKVMVADLYKAGLKKDKHLDLYQIFDVQKMLRLKKSLNGNETGLGKTLEMISVWLLSGEQELLAMSIRSGLPAWMRDLATFTDIPIELVNLTEQPLHESVSANKKITNTQVKKTARLNYLFTRPPPATRRVILMNYEMLPGFKEHLRTAKLSPPRVGFVALDEAHLLKEPTSARSKVVFGAKAGDEIGIEGDWKIVASATFIENGPEDLLSPLKYLARGGITQAEKMFTRLSIPQLTRRLLRADPQMMSAVHAYLSQRMVRRLKDVILKLPEKVWITAHLNMREGTMRLNDGPPISLGRTYVDQSNLYDLASRYPEQFEQDYVLDEKESLLRNARQLKSGRNMRSEQNAVDPSIFDVNIPSIKLDAAVYLTKQAVQQGKSVLIFTEYVLAAMHIHRLLEEAGQNEKEPIPELVSVGFIDGSVTDTPGNMARSDEIERFQRREIRAAAVTRQSMQHSRELTQADVLIFLDGPWTHSAEDQAIGRVLRRADPIRNYPGRKVQIIRLTMEVTRSIDKIKAAVREWKKMIADVFLDGRMGLAFIKTFRRAKAMEEETAAPPHPLDPNPHELGLIDQLRMLIGRVISEKNPDAILALLKQLAPIYSQLLEYKGSFLANKASLDYLSRDPRFQGRRLKILDAGSGPSVLLNAFRAMRGIFYKRNFDADVIDHDISAAMLEAGIPREGGQVVGSLDQLEQAYAPETFDIVNFSYSWRYAAHPAAMVQAVWRILKKDGLMVVILPKQDQIPPRFIEKLQEAGFSILVDNKRKLRSELSDTDKEKLWELYGPELAKDLEQQARESFTYLVVKKSRKSIADHLTDEDFRLERSHPAIGRDKVDRIVKEPGRLRIVPAEALIEGHLTQSINQLHPEEVSRYRNLLRPYTRLISLIADTTRRYELRSRRGADAADLQDLNGQIKMHLARLAELVNHPPLPLPRKERQKLVSGLEKLRDQKISRQWFHHDTTLPGLIDRLKGQRGIALPILPFILSGSLLTGMSTGPWISGGLLLIPWIPLAIIAFTAAAVYGFAKTPPSRRLLTAA